MRNTLKRAKVSGSITDKRYKAARDFREIDMDMKGNMTEVVIALRVERDTLNATSDALQVESERIRVERDKLYTACDEIQARAAAMRSDAGALNSTIESMIAALAILGGR